MRILALDPAGKKFGVAGIELVEAESGQKLSLYLKYLLESPDGFNSTQRTQYMSYISAALIGIDKPNYVISEMPWGQGYSSQTLKELIGAIKAETWQDIKWQGVSEARRGVLGESWGGAKKRETAEWLLSYPWNLNSKRFIEEQIAKASPDTDDGYDILDAILHGLYFLIENKKLMPVHKPVKEKKRASKNKKTT